MLLAIDVKYHRHEPLCCKNTSKYPPTSGWNGPKGTVPPENACQTGTHIRPHQCEGNYSGMVQKFSHMMIFECVFSRRHLCYDRVHPAFP